MLLLAATFLMYRLWQEEKKESARLSDNMKSLCTGLEEYKIRDSLNVVENHVLRLNIEELKEQRRADKAEYSLIVQENEIMEWEADNERKRAAWEQKQAQRNTDAVVEQRPE